MEEPEWQEIKHVFINAKFAKSRVGAEPIARRSDLSVLDVRFRFLNHITGAPNCFYEILFADLSQLLT